MQQNKAQKAKEEYPVPDSFAAKAHINEQQYQELYKRSITDNEGFWAEKAREHIDWIKPFSKVKDVSYDQKDLHIKWFYDGTLNVSANCLDRHLPQRANQVAFFWEGDDPKVSKEITYQQMFDEVCRLANAMKKLGVKKGDRVTIYMPMVPAAACAMLACTRIGAIHSVVFAGFSAESLAGRILDCKAKMVITADQGIRGNKVIPLKESTDKALEQCQCVESVIVYQRTNAKINWVEGRDHHYHQLIDAASPVCEPEEMNAEDPLFILYTSGSTGKPKGVLHTTAGYLVYASFTHKYVFDYHDGDVFWCAADVGWVTGHSYIVYAPLANAVTSVMFEGVPNYPDFSRFWQVCDKYKVNIFYAAPTALRSISAAGEELVKSTKRSSLQLLGTVGEPINPEAWRWYYKVVGEQRCPIIDTWWQTETGAAMIAPMPGATKMKPGSATRPMFGIKLLLLDDEGNELEGVAEGRLCIADSWPGQMRTVFGDHQRFVDTYFKTFPGKYETGDGARRDEDGFYWLTGRVDDVVNISGHRMGTAELESALVLHPSVAEAAVIGYPHQTKGEALYAYVTLHSGKKPSEELRKELVQLVRTEIGSFAAPEQIQWAPALPKTRSGKIMRRILRKVAVDQYTELGDTSTLTDASVVDDLIEARKNMQQA